MAVTDRNRHQSHTRLEQVLGHEEAAVLMEHLPPSGWADVARTRDLEMLELRFDAKLDRLSGEMDRRIADFTRTIVMTFFASQIAFVGVVLAAVG